MLLALLATAAAAPPDLVMGPEESPPVLVRVEDPEHPGAIARSATASLLEEPPSDDLPWRYETMAVPDGLTTGLGPEVLNADLWHAVGHRGQGVHVAVFDLQWEGAGRDGDGVDAEASADCWAHPLCEVPMDADAPRFGFETGVHGWSCAEIVRDIAPDARISLVRVNGYTTFASAVDWAIRHDVDVISMSMSFFNESFYDGTGPFDALMRELAANDILLVTSSGNYASQHWSGRWGDHDGDGRNDFDGDNALELVVNSRATIYFTWDEYRACGMSDLDVYVYDEADDLVARSERRQRRGEGPCSPLERISLSVDEPGTYRVEVVGHRVQATWLDLDLFALRATVVDPVPGFSMTDPGSHPLAFTVGAVQAEGYLDNDIEGFSSRGPVRSGAPKPDVAGPDGLSAQGFGARGFFGTSAATPAVAGAAALVLSRFPELTPREAGDRLKAWAIGQDPGFDDPRWGAGKVRLPVPEVEDGPAPCGRRPLWAGLLLPPALWFRRRRAPRASGTTARKS